MLYLDQLTKLNIRENREENIHSFPLEWPF